MTGHLYGVGLGPGDPELITRKAARLIATADVVAYHAGPRGNSIARSIAAELIPAGTVEEQLVYPVTTGLTEHPGGYAGAMAEFYEESAARLASHLDRGRDVVLLAEGDPLFYSSYMYMHDRLARDFPAEVVPGVSSVAAASAAVTSPLVRQTDVLTVLPGTMPEPELARRLADTQGAVIMKLGRTFPAVRSALSEAGRLDEALYVERASTGQEKVLPVKDVDPGAVPYFSVVLVPGDGSELATRYEHAVASGPVEVASAGPAATGALLVVGLGPAGADWTTPEVSAALDDVEHVVGYAPYLDRVPQRAGLHRHASGNTVEVDRARTALDLAIAGERVAIVSGGDAGVFGMASAVFEAVEEAVREDPRYAAVPIEVLPGMTAVQAVAARAGAPLGGDFCVLSLSDRLKPWAVVERRLRAGAEADLVLAVYNPASRSRTTQVGRAKDVLLGYREPGTPVVIGRDIGRPGESLEVTTLGALDPEAIDMRCLLIVGASGTSVGANDRVWTRRSVSS